MSETQLVNILFYLQGVAYKWLHVSAFFSKPLSGRRPDDGLENILFYLQGVAYKWLHVSAFFSKPLSGLRPDNGLEKKAETCSHL